MSEPQQPFGDAEPQPSLAELRAAIVSIRCEAFEEWNRLRLDSHRLSRREAERQQRRWRMMDAVLATLREVKAGGAGEPE